MRWSNGSLVNVSVNFEGIPAGTSLEQIARLSRQSVEARFRQAPDRIVVSFAIPGG